MATTYNTYTGDNSIVDFSFTFPYLNATDIKVSLDKVVQTLTTHYTLHNATTIRFGSAPGTGVAIKIYRDTDSTQLSSTFYPGSAIRSGDLNENFTQNLYVTQEAENDVADAIRLSEANVFTATQTYDNDNEIRFNEADANGSAYVGLKGATDKGTSDSYTLSLPAAPPAVNQILRAGADTGALLIWADEAINSTHVKATDNESANEKNLITFVEDEVITTGNVGLEMDGHFHYNPSTGTVTAQNASIDSLIQTNNLSVDGVLEADSITVNGTGLQAFISGVSSDSAVTATTATNSTHVYAVVNDSTDEDNRITFIEDETSGTNNVGLEFDNDFHYNPSTGTVTATNFKGDVDANNISVDGLLEADNITVNGTGLQAFISGVSADSAITATNSTNSTHVLGTVNDSTDKDNRITFIEDETSDTSNIGLEFDNDFHYNPSTGKVTATMFKGDVDANNISVDGLLEADNISVDGATLQTYIGGVSTDSAVSATTATTATNSTHVLGTVNDATNENNRITFIEDETSDTSNIGLEFDNNFHYNPSTGTVTATTFAGNLVGDVDANNGDFDGTLEADAYTINGVTLASYISGVSSDSAITATNANHVTITNNASTNENNLITFIEDAAGAGDRGLESDGDLHYNPSTGTVTATVFKGRVPNIPENAQGSYTLVATDAGKFINSTGTVTVPNSIFSAGDMVTIFNNSTGDRDITQGTGVTMYLGDGDGGNDSVKLGQRCVATILFITTSICVIQGGDLT